MNQPFAAPKGDIETILPAELAALPRWLLWRAIPDSQDKKPRKVPHYINHRPRSGPLGGADDLAQLATFAEAWHAYRSNPGAWAGIGFALIEGDKVGAMDIDNCIPEAQFGTQDRDVTRIMAAAFQSGCYIERSPSGRGLRIVGATSGFKTITKPVEAYCRDRFVTFTVDALANHAAWKSIDPIIRQIEAEWAPLEKTRDGVNRRRVSAAILARTPPRSYHQSSRLGSTADAKKLHGGPQDASESPERGERSRRATAEALAWH